MTVAAPRLIASGLFAIAFPMLIILAVIAQPLPHAQQTAALASSPSLSSAPPSLLSYSLYRSLAATPLRRLPIFHYAKMANNCLLRTLRQRQLKAITQQQQRQTATTAAAQQTARHSLNAVLQQQRGDDSQRLD
jgi:hypothetical protein